jgi:hypothetical protein
MHGVQCLVFSSLMQRSLSHFGAHLESQVLGHRLEYYNITRITHSSHRFRLDGFGRASWVHTQRWAVGSHAMTGRLLGLLHHEYCDLSYFA